MKSIMSMEKMLDRVGINLIETFDVVVAVDSTNPAWSMEADLNDPDQVEHLREVLLDLHNEKVRRMGQAVLTGKEAETRRKQQEWLTNQAIWLSGME